MKSKWAISFVIILLAAQATAGFGIRGAVGYGLGTNTFVFGDGDRQAGSEYNATASNGLAGGVEGLLTGGKVEFGLGIFAPLSVNADETSSYITTGGTQYSDETTAKSSNLPVIVSAYLRQPLKDKVSLICGAGTGVILPGDMKYESTITTITSGGMRYFDYVTINSDMNMALAFRGVLGTEVELSPGLSFFGGLNFIASALSPSKATRTETSSYSIDTVTEIITFQSEPPDRHAPTSTTTTTSEKTVMVTDDGITRTTATHYNATGKDETLREIKAVKRSQAIDQLSLLVGLTYRF